MYGFGGDGQKVLRELSRGFQGNSKGITFSLCEDLGEKTRLSPKSRGSSTKTLRQRDLLGVLKIK